MGTAHEMGKINTFVDAAEFPTDLQEVASAVNDMVRGHSHLQDRLITTVQAVAKGDLDYELERFPGEKAQINDSVDLVRAAFRKMNEEILRASQAIQQGDRSLTIDLDNFEGEYHNVMLSFDQTFGELGNLVNNLKTQINEITKAAELVSSTSSTLSAGAQHTSSAIDQISSSFDETESMVRATSSAANSAMTVATTANETASEGRDTMARMKQAMEGIDSSARSISPINKVIDEIAFQTNLLALNAAVEAARAGQHGRGFAVLAQEVRNLAQRSAQAARETTDLIDKSDQAITEGVTHLATTGSACRGIAEALG